MIYAYNSYNASKIPPVPEPHTDILQIELYKIINLYV